MPSLTPPIVAAPEGHQHHRSPGGFGWKPSSAMRKSSKLGKGQYQLYKQQVEPLLRQGYEQQAEPVLRLLAQGQSPLPEVFRDLGMIYEKRKEPIEAELWYKRWLSLLPSHANERLAQARKAEQLSWPDLALQRYLDVLELQPTQPDALHRASALWLERYCFEEAMAILITRLEHETPTDELWIQASWCSLELGSLDDAVCWANLARVTQPAHPIVLTVQARQYQHKGDYSQALDLAQQALSRAVETSEWTVVNRLLARLLFEQGLLEMSQTCLNVAIQAEPLRAELHRLRGEILLLQNHLHEGFIEYCWCQPSPSLPTVEASKLIKSSNIALLADGTLGDTLLFSRYAVWLRQYKDVNVRLFVQPPLHVFLRHSIGNNLPVHMLQDFKPGSVHGEVVLPLLSAPAVYGTSQEYPELTYLYGHADQHLVNYWRERLQLIPGERLVGVNWCGSPMNAIAEYYKSDIPIEAFAPLATLPSTRLISFQKGFGSKQLLTCSFRERFVACQQEVTAETRFEHTAALMSLCDWVVSDDSGPAHLSGHLGVPSVVMLPPLCNWRWGASGDDSPWYHRTILLRRSIDQSWASLVDQACALVTAH